MTQRYDWTNTNLFAPAAAGDEAYRLFCRPHLSPHRPLDHDALAKRARVHLERARWFTLNVAGTRIQAYQFDPLDGAVNPSGQAGRNILLVHGWTSEAAFMSAFIEPLRHHGHRITLFDLPAHGRSSGRSASLIDLARATLDVARTQGPFDIVIAHSIGGIAALLAAEGHIPLPAHVDFGSFVLVATPNRFQDVARAYGHHLALSDMAQAHFERRLERIGHRTMASMTAAALLHGTNCPALVVHSRDDVQVPFSDAEEIIKAVPAARLAAFDHFAHAGVLFAPPVIRVIRDYCDGSPG